MASATLLRGRELLPADVVRRELPSFFVSLPSCAVFQRAVPAFVVLGQPFPDWDLR